MRVLHLLVAVGFVLASCAKQAPTNASAAADSPDVADVAVVTGLPDQTAGADAGGAANAEDISIVADVGDAAIAAAVDSVGAPADAGAPKPDVSATDGLQKPDTGDTISLPPNWFVDPKKQPRAQHMTWQHDPATTVTISWAVDWTDMTTYLPKAWVVSAAAASADPEKTLPMLPSYVYTGTGKAYPTLAGDTPIDDVLHVTCSVEVTGLKPETLYYYRVGTWDSIKNGEFVQPNLSELGHFRTTAAKGKVVPFQVVLAGDSRGGMDNIAKNMDKFSKIDAAMWFFNGDFTTAGLQDQWDSWITVMQPVMRYRVLMPVQGNHEIFANLYYEQFALPVEPLLPELYKEHAWAVNVSNVHFVGFDSNDVSSVQEQLPWLEADLKAAQADKDIEWTIVMAHHPAYSSSNHGSTDYLRKYVVPLCEKYGVDLVFSGHDHDYERTKPIKGEKVVAAAEGIYYIVAGGFFSPPYANGKNWWTEISAHGDLYNYVVLAINGKKIELKAYSGDSKTLIDSLTISH